MTIELAYTLLPLVMGLLMSLIYLGFDS